MEKRTEVKTVKVELVCDSCEEGVMVACGDAALAHDPPHYPHGCTKCGERDVVEGKTYPYMVYE